MKLTLSLIIDVIFSTFICFVLSFVVLYYYVQRSLAIILSILISLLLAVFFYRLLLKKTKNTNLKKTDALKINDMSTQLNLYSETEQCAIFESALKKDNYVVDKKKGALNIKNKNSVIFPKFSFDGITKTDIVKIFNYITPDQTAYILSENFSSEIKDFASRFDGRIKTICADEVYLYLKERDCLPKDKFVFTEKSRLKLSALKNIFQKKKAKNLLWFGLIFLFSSFFVPIKTYYVICGAIFLFLALISRLYGKETPLQTN